MRTMIERVRREIGGLPGPRISDLALMDYINEAVRTLVAVSDMENDDLWLRTTEKQTQTTSIVAGTSAYALPANFFRPVALFVTDSRGEVRQYPLLSVRMAADTNDRGYTIDGTNFNVLPEPATAVTNGLAFYYLLAPSEVTTLAGSIGLSDVFADRIKLHAVMRAKAAKSGDASAMSSFYQLTQRTPETVQKE